MITAALLIIIASLFAIFLKKALKVNKYWEERDVKYKNPLPFFGNNLPMILGQKSLPEIIESIFAQFPNEQVIGYYDFMVPRLYVRDPDLIQKVLIKDFGHFTDHGVDLDMKKNPRDEQLFVINGSRWRAVRTKLSPIFTSGKLKEMFSTMTSVGENLLIYLKEREEQDIDARELMGLFSMDVISSAVFGMDPATLRNPDCEFRQKGRQINDQANLKNFIRMWLVFSFPKIMKKFGIALQDRALTNYFCNIIQNAFEYRKEKGIQRNDFIQMMMQLKEKGHVEVQSLDESDDYLKTDMSENNLEKVEFTDDLIMAQAHSFMTAGFEATAVLMSYTMYELCRHEDLQTKVCEEVAEQVKLHGGLSYDALKNMKLLECSIKEAQRLYHLVPMLLRVCTKKYEMPNGYVVEKGEKVAVPVAAIHTDPNNFPEPKLYKPQRFFDPIKPGTFMPFGDGPRMCIAMRYTMLVMKYGLAVFFMNYRVKLSPKTPVPLRIQPRSFNGFPKDKILLQLQKLTHCNGHSH